MNNMIFLGWRPLVVLASFSTVLAQTPNNSFNTATPIAVGNAFVKDTIESAADQNYMKFNAVQGCGYTIEVANEQGVDIRFDVYNGLQNSISSGNPNLYKYICATSGTNYVRVYRWGGTSTGSYTIRVLPAHWNHNPGPSWDQNFEPNQTSFNAQPIVPSGVIYSNTIETSGDEDYFRFVGTLGVTYTIALTDVNGVDPRFDLSYENGSHALESISSGNSRLLEWTCLQTGTYSLHVYRWGGLTAGTYKISVTASATVVSVAMYPKVVCLKVDSSYSLTTLITDGSALTYSSLNPSVATVDQAGVVTAHAIGNTRIRATSTTAPGSFDETIIIAGPANRYEPNNSFSTATAINVGNAYQLHTIEPSSDQDYLKFDAIQGYGYSVQVENEQGVDIRFDVYNNVQNTISSGNANLYKYICATTGTNYIRVYRWGGEDVGSYTIRVIPAYWDHNPDPSWDH